MAPAATATAFAAHLLRRPWKIVRMSCAISVAAKTVASYSAKAAVRPADGHHRLPIGVQVFRAIKILDRQMLPGRRRIEVNVEIGRNVRRGDGKPGDGRIHGNDQARGAVHGAGAQVLMLFGPPSIC